MTEPTKQPDHDDKMSSEDYEHLLDRYQYSTKEITMGKVLKGQVIKMTPTHVLVDIGFKTEGLIPNEEFTDPKARGSCEPGERGRDHARERPTSRTATSSCPRSAPTALRAIEDLDQAFERGQTVTGTIIERTQGGFNVDVGIAGLPARIPRRHPAGQGRRRPSSARPSSSGSSSSTARPRTPSCRASSSSRTSGRRRGSTSSATWPRARRSRARSSP